MDSSDSSCETSRPCQSQFSCRGDSVVPRELRSIKELGVFIFPIRLFKCGGQELLSVSQPYDGSN